MSSGTKRPAYGSSWPSRNANPIVMRTSPPTHEPSPPPGRPWPDGVGDAYGPGGAGGASSGSGGGWASSVGSGLLNPPDAPASPGRDGRSGIDPAYASSSNGRRR